MPQTRACRKCSRSFESNAQNPLVCTQCNSNSLPSSVHISSLFEAPTSQCNKCKKHGLQCICMRSEPLQSDHYESAGYYPFHHNFPQKPNEFNPFTATLTPDIEFKIIHTNQKCDALFKRDDLFIERLFFPTQPIPNSSDPSLVNLPPQTPFDPSFPKGPLKIFHLDPAYKKEARKLTELDLPDEQLFSYNFFTEEKTSTKPEFTSTCRRCLKPFILESQNENLAHPKLCHLCRQDTNKQIKEEDDEMYQPVIHRNEESETIFVEFLKPTEDQLIAGPKSAFYCRVCGTLLEFAWLSRSSLLCPQHFNNTNGKQSGSMVGSKAEMSLKNRTKYLDLLKKKGVRDSLSK